MQKSIVTGCGGVEPEEKQAGVDSPSYMGVGNEQLFQQFSESKVQP